MTVRLGRILACALVLMCVPPAHALDPALAITQYARQVWNTDQGLPQNSVFAVCQTRDGYLWLATQEGLVRFDGVRFTVFDSRNTPAIRHNDVWALHEDRTGALWIGTRGGGLVRYKRGQFKGYTTADGLADDAVQALAEDADGSLWVGTRGGGLSRLTGETFQTFSTGQGLAHANVFALLADDTGLWIGSEGGLDRLADGAFRHHGRAEGLADGPVSALHADAGGLWVGTGAGLSRIESGGARTYRKADGLPHDGIRTLASDRAGNLWVGTDGGGLARFRDGRFSAYTNAQGLANDNVGAIHEDREGNLWVGTDAGGLTRFKDPRFVSYGVAEGLASDNVRSVMEDAEGNVWVGSFGGVDRWRDGVLRSFTRKDGLSADAILSLAADGRGGLWLGTLGGGLNHLRDGKVKVYGKDAGLSNDTVLALLGDRDGSLWAGTRAGLNHFRDGKFKTYTTADGLTSNDVRVLHQDAAGTLWIGTLGGGLNRFRDGAFTAWRTAQGLSSERVLALHEDADGTLWIGTFGGGLNRLRDGAIKAVTSRDGLFDDAIFQILEDDDGFLWMSSNRGVSRVSRAKLNDFLDGKRQSLGVVAYGKADGMRSNEGNGAHQPAGWKSRDGRLWFATIGGVVAVDPRRMPANAVPPPVTLEQSLADGQPLAAGADLAAGTKKLEFHFTALSLRAPDKLKFKYRLEGFDAGWVDGGNGRAAYYTNIPPGQYRFSVIAANDDGVWNRGGDSVTFSLAPFYWQHPSFALVYVLGGALLILVGVRLNHVRVRFLEQREEELLSLVQKRDRAEQALRRVNQALEQRAAELARSNDELERFAYVASHDLKEPLRSVIGFTQLLARRYRGQLDADADRYIGFAVDGALHMQTLIDNLLAYSGVGRGEAPAHRTDLGDALGRALANLQTAIAEQQAEVTHDALPTLVAHPGEMVQLLQNLIANAVKFRGRAAPRVHVAASLDAASGAWQIAVRDNGIGIDPQFAPKVFALFRRLHNRDDYPGTGLGLAICKKIVERHGGRIWVEPAEGGGSRFVFTLPATPVVTAPASNEALAA